jgi:hypothetical protein
MPDDRRASAGLPRDDERRLETFLRLSRHLTGVADLDRVLAEHYLARFADQPGCGELLPDLLGAFAAVEQAAGDVEAAIDRDIMRDPTLGPPARQLIYLWYVGAFFESYPLDPTRRRGTWRYGTEADDYGRGLMWSVVRAHAPMTPGGSGEYWSEPPDLDREPTTPPPGWLDA